MSKEAMKLVDALTEYVIPDGFKYLGQLRKELAKPDFWEGYEPEPVKSATTETNGGKTGWPPGLLQDDCKGLSKWLSNKPDAKRRVREALDKKAENARELGLDYEPARDNSNYRFDPPGLDPSHQKPVAWWIPKAKQFCLPSSDGTRPFAKAWEPLYTSPPAQKECKKCSHKND